MFEEDQGKSGTVGVEAPSQEDDEMRCVREPSGREHWEGWPQERSDTEDALGMGSPAGFVERLW